MTITKNKEIPCKDCLVKPRCKYKPYRQLLQRCELLMELLYVKVNNLYVMDVSTRVNNFNKIILGVEKELDPYHWMVYQNKYFYDIQGKNLESPIDKLKEQLKRQKEEAFII